jgi:hypothetical protein
MKSIIHVHMFKTRFAPMVRAGTKCQTIRPMRQRRPKVGDLADLRMWSGMPCRSPQRKLRLKVITDVELVALDYSGVTVGGKLPPTLDQFARADGFGDWPECLVGLIAPTTCPSAVLSRSGIHAKEITP